MLSSFLLTLAVLSMSLCFKFLLNRQKTRGGKLPPGKMGWPIIGESLEFLTLAQRGKPEKFVMDRMRKHSPKVFRTSLIGYDMAVFCGPSGNKFLFSNEEKLVTSWWPRSVVKVIHSPSSEAQSAIESKKLRDSVVGFSKPEALRKFVGIIDYVARQHIDTEWAPKEEVSAFELSKKYTFDLACRLFFSIEDPNLVEKLGGHFKDMTSGMFHLPINFPGTPFNRCIKAAAKIRKELLAIIKQKKIALYEKGELAASQDILSHMLFSTSRDAEYPNDVHVADRMLGLLLAGHDTTAVAITFIIKYLAEFPQVYNDIFREQLEIANTKKPDELLNWEDINKMTHSWNVAKEAMRLAPPVHGTFREAITDFTYAGYTIPKGFKVHWTAHSTHKNPKYFTNPEKFDPTRFQQNEVVPYSFVPFGGGPRMCPGKEYARLEILAFLHNLVTRFKWETLIPNEKIVYKAIPNPANGLPIRLHPHVIIN